MTTPNLDALAKLAPFESTRNCVWPRDHDVPPIGLRDIAAALNEWAELRTEKALMELFSSTNAKLVSENADLRAYRERARWQPIETAPKDGTEVLLLVRGESGAIFRAIGVFDMGHWFGHVVSVVEPTQWAPLPALPGQGATNGK